MNTELLSLTDEPVILVRLCDIRTLPATDALITKAENIIAAEEVSSALRYRQENDKRMALCSRLLQQCLLRGHSSRHRSLCLSPRSRVPLRHSTPSLHSPRLTASTRRPSCLLPRAAHALPEKIERQRSGQKPIWIPHAEERSPFIHFNVSHDTGLVVLSASRLLVGVDCMQVTVRGASSRSVADLLRAMDSQCVGRERPYVLGEDSDVSDEEKLRRFMKIWTMKEAFVKACGTGVYVDPARLECVLPEYDSPTACTPAPSLACPYTPEYDLNEDTHACSPGGKANPGQVLSGEGPTAVSTQETYKSLSLESDEDTGEDRPMVRIMMDGEEQKNFGFAWLDASVAPGFIICVCWGPVQAAQKKYLECMPEREREAIKAVTARRISRESEKRFSRDEGFPCKDAASCVYTGTSRLPRFDVRWVSGETLVQEPPVAPGKD
ncbi:4'-phosphopantetheinyl transferase superfamily protein [Toxoplasma gondii TgCatPRC2]|uniref:holo-[acyl-carrier-protein] synthase n=1 Tax=Toxoplasma gondii TgCatPRC2 TaxID=1130821 RepID=A0A151HF51_TOXGO|nr:4'-phosphopantetheinyl transferase superfamily protein [Toxoplasma gondii TgCatPRC2]